MGSFLTCVDQQRQRLPQQTFFSKWSLSKLRELHAYFRALCDTFSVDDSEFTEIFGEHPDVFELLDDDSNLLIDGLQLFAGLVLFSGSHFESKLQFLFDLFDFNDFNSLSCTDIEFLVLSCCTATHKILGLRTPVNEQLLRDLMAREFVMDRRVNISELMRWATHSHDVRCFFELIQRKAPQPQTLFSQKLYYSDSLANKSKSSTRSSKPNSEAVRKFEEWTDGLSRKLLELQTAQSQPFRNSELSIGLDWVYGIRCLDVKKPFLRRQVHQREVLLYATANLVMLLFTKIGRQSHYSSHEHEVVSLCEERGLVASGELTDNPAIHLWELDSQRTKKVLRNCHKRGVYMLKFGAQGQQLYSCGLQPQPAVIVHSVATGEVLFSTSSPHYLTEITDVLSFLREEDNQRETMLFSLREINCLKTLQDGRFQSSLLLSVGSASNITCGMAMKYNRTNRYLKHYQSADEAVCAMLTGHELGELYHWEQGIEEYRKQLLKTYPAEVVQLTAVEDFIVVVSFSSFLDVWSIELKLLRTIDVTTLGLKLFSYDLIQAVPVSTNECIVMSQRGDMVRLAALTNLQSQVRATRISNISCLPGSQRCISLLEKEGNRNIYVGGSEGIVYGFNSSTHELVDTWNINEPMAALDVCSSPKGGCMLVAATERNRIYMRIDMQEVEKHYECSKPILDLKMIGRGSTVLVACEDRYLYVLGSSTKSHFSNVKRIDLDSSLPRSLFVMQQKVLIATDENKLYLLSLADHKYRLLDGSCDSGLVNSMTVRLKHTLRSEDTTCVLPVVCTPKAILMGSPEGWLCYSRSHDSLANRVVGYFGHLHSGANDIVVTPDLRYALATGNDKTLLSYKLRLSCERRFLQPTVETVQQSSTYDEMLTREISYCLYANNSLSVLHDQHMLVRGINNPMLGKLLHGMMDDWKEMSRTPSKHPPPVNLTLDYLYGVQTFERRDSVCYVANPKRFLYYVAKVAVLYNPQTNSQQFYQGHRARITCLTLLGEGRVASGQAAYRPCIRVWHHDTLQTIRVLQTGHRWGITHLTSLNNLVLSCGIEDKLLNADDKESLTFSLQVTHSQCGQLIAYQKIGSQPIYSMKFDPLNDQAFVTAGDNNATFWQMNSLGLQRQVVCTTDQEVVTACEFFCYKTGGRSCCELLLGMRSGSIYTISPTKKLVLLRKKAHTKTINCIRLAMREHFVTVGEDEYLKVWNDRFECIYEQQMRRIDFFREIAKLNSENKYFEKATVERNLSVQSVSMWPEDHDESKITMLLATRNGEVLQTTICDQGTEGKYNLYMRNHCSQLTGPQPHKRLFFSLHPRFGVLLTLGQDQNLFLWDTEKNKIIASKTLGYVAHPTCAKFNRDGDIIVVGFSDGLLIFLDTKIIKSNQGKNDEKYIVPTLNLVQKHKQEKRAAVLNIEFSEGGEHLAVSFNSSHSERARYDPSIPNDPSFISLFVSRAKDKKKPVARGVHPDKLYSWFTDVRCQQGEKTYYSQYGSVSSMASYFMSFAECEDRTYLLIYYQLVDSNNIRLNHSTDADYIVWDVNTSTIVVNLESIANVQWKRLNVPNSIDCRYQLYNDLVWKKKQLQPPRNNNLLKPEITSMFAGRHKYAGDSDSLNVLFMGSLNGDVHVAWTKSIDCGESCNQASKDEEMFLARSYTAHNSFVDHVEVSANGADYHYLYTSGIDDQCVAKWRISSESSTVPAEGGFDVFGDVPTEEQLHRNREVHQRRQLLASLKSYDRDLYHCHNKQPLRLKAIVGRSANRHRNNLFFDCEGQVVYPIGCNVIRLQPATSQQSVLFDAEGQFNCADQISAMTMAEDRRLLAVGTHGKLASVSLWQVRSKQCLQRLSLPELECVLKLAFSENLCYLLVYGLDHEHIGTLLVLDLREEEVLVVTKMKHQASWVIKAAQFLPGTFEEFITCGVNHLCSWQLRGAELNYTRLAVRDGKDTQKELVLFSLLMLKEHGYATCCDSGYVYLMSYQHKLLSRQKGHDGWCLSLSWEAQNNRLVSGGRDGKVALWKIDNGQLALLSCTSVTEAIPVGLQDPMAKQFLEIESIDLFNNLVVVGVRNGSIYVLALDTQKFSKGAPTTMVFHAQQCTRGMFFSDDERELFEVSESGLLSIWSVQPLKCRTIHNFGRTVSGMLSCHNRQDVFFVVFENEIIAIHKNDSTFKPIEDFKVAFGGRILAVALSANHKLLAASIEKFAEKKARICVYDVATAPSFKLLFQTHLAQSPEYIDFSSNNRILLCKNPDKDLLVDLMSWAVSTAHHEGLEWCGEGVKHLARLSAVNKMYAQQVGNRITRVIELFENFYVFTDGLGTVRVFYKAKEESSAELMSMNMQHLNNINLCVRSRRASMLATCSEEDRSIIIWQIDQKFK